jgi:hypothetical protein
MRTTHCLKKRYRDLLQGRHYYFLKLTRFKVFRISHCRRRGNFFVVLFPCVTSKFLSHRGLHFGRAVLWCVFLSLQRLR